MRTSKHSSHSGDMGRGCSPRMLEPRHQGGEGQVMQEMCPTSLHPDLAEHPKSSCLSSSRGSSREQTLLSRKAYLLHDEAVIDTQGSQEAEVWSTSRCACATIMLSSKQPQASGHQQAFRAPLLEWWVASSSGDLAGPARVLAGMSGLLACPRPADKCSHGGGRGARDSTWRHTHLLKLEPALSPRLLSTEVVGLLDSRGREVDSGPSYGRGHGYGCASFQHSATRPKSFVLGGRREARACGRRGHTGKFCRCSKPGGTLVWVTKGSSVSG